MPVASTAESPPDSAQITLSSLSLTDAALALVLVLDLVLVHADRLTASASTLELDE